MKYFSEEDKKRIKDSRLNKDEKMSGDTVRYRVTVIDGRPCGIGFNVRSFRGLKEAEKYFDEKVAISKTTKKHFKTTLRKVVTHSEKLREVEQQGED